MVFINVKCSKCQEIDVIKYGFTELGKQRYKCKNKNCLCNTFILDYSYKGLIPGLKEEIIDMTLNASGIRDISRVKKISPETVMNEIKKQETSIVKVNQQVINEINKKKQLLK